MFTVGFDTSALDVAFKSHAQRGIGRYVSELKRYFDSIPPGDVRVGFFNHASFFGGGIVKPLLNALPAGVNTVRQQILFPLQLSGSKTKGFDCVHFPAHMDAPSWSAKPCIVTVLDLIPLILSDLYKPDRGNFRFHLARWLEIRAIRNAQLILTISENTARDVHRILHIPEERIVVTPLGVDEKFFTAAMHEPEAVLRGRYGIAADRPIVLYVGGIDQRKNYPVLLSAFAEVVKERRRQQRILPILLMAGRIQNDRQFPKLSALIAHHDIVDSVVMPGFVDDGDLLQLYKVSTVFFFPSLYEGFGLPPLEAMAAGLPVISSNSSCMPEVLGDAAVFIDPTDSLSAARVLAELIDDPQRLAQHRELGLRRARLFPWSETGAKTLKAYELFESRLRGRQ